MTGGWRVRNARSNRPGTPIAGLGRAFIVGSEGRVRDYLQRTRPPNPVVVGYECLHKTPCPEWDRFEMDHEDGSTVIMHATSAYGVPP